MLSTQQALSKILGLLSATETEVIPLRHAAGRVLAQNAQATRDQPPFRSSAMDGYAVRSADIDTNATFTIIGQSKAGLGFSGTIAADQAVRIFTGAPVPEGADHILIQEDVREHADTITLQANFDPSPHIRAEGSDFKNGHIFAAPKRLDSADIGLLAAMGLGSVKVHKKPVVALICTGDELVMPGETPNAAQIYSSNGLAIAALLEQHGAIANLLPIASDSTQSLGAAIDLAQGCDLMVTIGGASVGDHDLVRETALGKGLHLEFWKVAMRPGKPLIAGKLAQTPFLGLPGNPVSAMTCAHIFLRPALGAMLGLPAAPLPRLRGKLCVALGANGPREHYMRGTATFTASGWHLTPADRQDSSLLSIMSRSNAFIVAPPSQPELEIGAEMEFILL